MKEQDLKFYTWYIEDNGWNRLWFYKTKNEWIIFDPDTSDSLSRIPFSISNFTDDNFKESKINVVNQSELKTRVFNFVFNSPNNVSLNTYI